MNNNDMARNENEEDDSDISSENNNEENISNNRDNLDNLIEENEKEFDLDNECGLNITLNSIISLEKQINDISASELISIKQFRRLLGIFGHISTNFIVERLYQVLIRISSKKYQHVSSDLTKKDFLNYLSIVNNSEIHHEIYYLFFDITNKGYITKKDFINVINHMCETICEFIHKNSKIYKEYLSNLYEYLLRINMNEYMVGDNSQQWISKSKFIKLIESGAINFYDIMNVKNFGNNITITQKQYGIFKDIMYSIKDINKKITQKENIESNLSIITGNYLDNVDTIKDEYKELQTQTDLNNNSFTLANASYFLDKPLLNESIQGHINYTRRENYNSVDNISKNFTFNKNNISNSNSDIININTNNSFITIPKLPLSNKMKSPQERIQSDRNLNHNSIDENENDLSLNSFKSDEENDDEELNYKILNEEKEDSVNEMDIKSIKNIENIKEKMKNKKINTNKESPLNQNKKKHFFFLKPFKIKNDRDLAKELKKNNIDIDNTLILLKKDNFMSYLDTLENCFLTEINDINISNNIPYTIKDSKSSIILNKPLKEKEIYGKEKKFEYTLNNTNMEIMFAIILGIEKCVSTLGDYELQDKNYINSLIPPEDSNKTTRKRKNTMFPPKIEKIEKKNTELYDAISNYPFKKYKCIFEEINIFHYNCYTIDKKDENNINYNKIEIIEYAPQIFCNIRYSIGEITNKTFLHSFNIESLISNLFFGNINNLSQLLTINKENFPEFIMFSSDTKYIIKCISQNEFEVLQKILPNYYEYLMTSIVKNILKINRESQRSNTITSTYSSSDYKLINSNIESKHTLLDIIYGIYSINLFDKKLFFIIKKNIFYSYNNLSISKKYDLKGSSIDRTSKKNLDVFKDLDYIEFHQKLNLSTKASSHLSEIIKKDTSFLSENNIINYSFYIGIAEISDSLENEENEQGILSSDKNNMYYFGISDIFTQYGAGKKMEHIFKKITKGSGISAVPPFEYKNRFDNFINLCMK